MKKVLSLNSENYIAPSGLAYIDPVSDRTSNNTEAYLRVTAGYYEYDPITSLPSEFVSMNYAKLTVKRNGANNTPIVSVSYPRL